MALDFTLDDLEVKEPDAETLLTFLAEMEFRTLSKRMADQLGMEAPAIPEAPAAAAAQCGGSTGSGAVRQGANTNASAMPRRCRSGSTASASAAGWRLIPKPPA